MIELKGNETLIRWAIALVFAAGGYLAAFKRLRKDVNGIGKRGRTFEKNATLAIMASCPEEKRTEVAELLKQED